MARYRSWDDYHYTPIHEKQAKARKSLSRLAKSRGTLQPVTLEGRTLSTSWWGQAWNENLERYSDYSNRLPRGRSYLRNGMVLHLAIEPGKVTALVQGSRPTPYEVTITVAALKPARWAKARAACAGQLDSLQALLMGRFPDTLKDLFMVQGEGLFPAPKEISFECTCPDWASMCKHVAAVLYGVGTRLDADPKLFFTLRQVSVDELVAKALQGTSEALLDKAGKAAGKALATADLGNVFGIDLDDAPGGNRPAADAPPAPRVEPPATRGRARAAEPAPAAAPPPPRRRLPAAARPARKASSPPSVRAATPQQPSRRPSAPRGRVADKTRAARTTPMLDRLLDALRGKRSGLSIPAIMTATGFSEVQARNTVARAMARDLVRSTDRGVYALV